jgi:hypothetical protein
LSGIWSGGEGEVFSNPWGPAGPTKGRWSFILDRSGFNLRHEFEEQRPGGYLFESHGTLTVDPTLGDLVWFWFDS